MQLDAALAGAAAVVMCLDDVGSHVLRAAVARGMSYVDITADRTLVAEGRMLAGEAVRTGARAVLAMGHAPGITNVLAASVASRVR